MRNIRDPPQNPLNDEPRFSLNGRVATVVGYDRRSRKWRVHIPQVGHIDLRESQLTLQPDLQEMNSPYLAETANELDAAPWFMGAGKEFLTSSTLMFHDKPEEINARNGYVIKLPNFIDDWIASKLNSMIRYFERYCNSFDDTFEHYSEVPCEKKCEWDPSCDCCLGLGKYRKVRERSSGGPSFGGGYFGIFPTNF